jgi:hypothetical protein
MLQLAGMIQEPWSEAAHYREFRELFGQYEAGYDFDKEQLQPSRTRKSRRRKIMDTLRESFPQPLSSMHEELKALRDLCPSSPLLVIRQSPHNLPGPRRYCLLS